MVKSKRRILFCGEASWLSTGFATYNREIITRLHKTGKYEIAEMGAYGSEADPAASKLPWKFYGVLPKNQTEKEIYDQNPVNQFGKYKIEAVVADFQPDIIFDARDPWMLQHLIDSRFRGNYKTILMPTVDSAPQRKDWIKGIFAKSDVLTTYSRYGKRVLESEGLKVSDVTSPGVDLDVWKPLDKIAMREKYHINKSLLIIGTVMRNQKRKLYPELFDAYAKLRTKHATRQKIIKIKNKVKKAVGQRKNPNLSKEEKNALIIDHSALLCHTSYPDVGWDIPELLARYGLQRHVIFTYKCDSCSTIFHSWFIPCDKKGKCLCRVCGSKTAHMPNTHSGVEEKDLIEIFNLMDIYVQPAICEGWGLPIMESKACGVPGLYQNYSAMEDHVENGGGLSIEVGRLYTEAETMAFRSLPDIDDMIKKIELLAFNKSRRLDLGERARQCVVKMHNWEITANKIMDLFDSTEIHDRNETWNKNPKFKEMTQERPQPNLPNDEFVHWCYINILGRAADQQGFNDWMQSLSNGTTRDSVESYFRQLVDSNNKFESIRWNNSLKIRGLVQENYQPAVSKKDILNGALF